MTEPNSGNAEEGAAKAADPNVPASSKPSRTAEKWVIVGLLLIAGCLALFEARSGRTTSHSTSAPSTSASTVATASAQPSAAPGAIDPVGTGSLPPEVLFKAVTEMQKSSTTRLKPKQSSAVAQHLSTLVQNGKEKVDVTFVDTAAAVLTPAQLSFARQQPPPESPTDPLAKGTVWLQEKAGKAKPAAAKAKDPLAADLKPWMVLQAAPLMKDALAMTPSQAAALLPAARALVQKRDATVAEVRQIVAVLEQPQRAVVEEVLKTDPKATVSIDDAIKSLGTPASGAPAGPAARPRP